MGQDGKIRPMKTKKKKIAKKFVSKEDVYFAKLVEGRLKTKEKWLTHEEVWKDQV